MSASANLKPDWGEVRIIARWIVVITVTGILFTIAVMMAGCASAPRLSISPPPTAPCVRSLSGARPGIISVAGPEKMPYEDADGNQKLAMVVAVDPDSFLRLFNYIASLEAIADAAQKCVAR